VFQKRKQVLAMMQDQFFTFEAIRGVCLRVRLLVFQHVGHYTYRISLHEAAYQLSLKLLGFGVRQVMSDSLRQSRNLTGGPL
jgi:hypothetical protein